MIDIKEIRNRVYENKTLTRFDIYVKLKEEQILYDKTYLITFSKGITEWSLKFIIPKNDFCESIIYQINYEIPMANPKLELIASTGLKMLQQVIKNDVMRLTKLDFKIGNMVENDE